MRWMSDFAPSLGRAGTHPGREPTGPPDAPSGPDGVGQAGAVGEQVAGGDLAGPPPADRTCRSAGTCPAMGHPGRTRRVRPAASRPSQSRSSSSKTTGTPCRARSEPGQQCQQARPPGGPHALRPGYQHHDARRTRACQRRDPLAGDRACRHQRLPALTLE